MKTGDISPYIAFFDPKKWDIENSPCLVQPNNADFDPQKGNTGSNIGDISTEI